MVYTIVDLIAKLIAIEQNACKMYKNIAFMENGDRSSFKTVAKVLAKEEERHVEFYHKLMKKAAEFPDIEIDFELYDKASSLIQEFKKRIIMPADLDTGNIIAFALEFEKQNAALLIDIRGRLFKKSEDTESTIYMALTDLIIEEEKHVKNLKCFVKS